MHIIIVHLKELNDYPPVRSLLEFFLKRGAKITLVCYDNAGVTYEYVEKGVDVIGIKANAKSAIGKAKAYIMERHQLRKILNALVPQCDIVWTTTDLSAVQAGHKLLGECQHIMQVMELTKDVPEYPHLYIKMAHLDSYARQACCVVMPELTRALISKQWWKLKQQPYVLPNKPLYKVDDCMPERYFEILNKVKAEQRKIILYQGGFGKDRYLDDIVGVISKMPEFALYLMGHKNEKIENWVNSYSNIVHIPFINPPYHLEVCQFAYIGLLPYQPTDYYKNLSELNALFCAPNKIYEYALNNLPMLGSNMPGLLTPFTIYGIGECYQSDNVKSIMDGINKIDKNYSFYKDNCQAFYNAVNIEKKIEDILQYALNKCDAER